MPSTLAPIAPISRCSASTAGRGSCARNDSRNSATSPSIGREQIVARPVLARSGDPLAEVAYRALERHDGVSRRQIGETARHRGEFGAQTLDIGGGRLASFRSARGAIRRGAGSAWRSRLAGRPPRSPWRRPALRRSLARRPGRASAVSTARAAAAVRRRNCASRVWRLRVRPWRFARRAPAAGARSGRRLR